MSISLLELSNKVKSCEESFSRKIVLFGPPGSGKTHIAATIARVPTIKRVHWFDLENGIETIIYAKDSQGNPLLTPEELSKILVYRIHDTAELPRAAETFLKAFTKHSGVKLCQEHGKVDCKECSELLPFNIFTMEEDEAIVIDSGSQLSDSVLNLAILQSNNANLVNHYGVVSVDMGAILTSVQSTKANVVVCTHEHSITKKVKVSNTVVEDRLVRVVPMIGSRNFSDKVGKYFGYKIYTYNNGSTFRATAKQGKKDKVLVSSRRPVSFEDDTDPSLERLFVSEEEASKAAEAAPKAGLKPAISIKM